MATALDLLMSTKEDVNLLSEESDICTIDAKTRVIFVPSTIVVGGVQSDKNAERIKFSCPKIVGDNLDLSKFSVRINFENVSSVDFNVSIKDQYICDDVAVDGENVTFSWLIGRNAARYMGTVRFIVCAVKTDSDSNISVEWNTTIAEVPVLEGIEIDQPQIGQEEKDVINQLLELTKNTSAEAVQNVNSAKEQAIKDIQSVSQPDTTLTIEGGLAEAKATGEAIGSLKEDISNKITKFYASSQGETHLVDSDNGKIMDMMLYGKSEQKQYSGKNVIDFSLYENEYTQKGITIKLVSNGIYRVTGTAISEVAFSLASHEIKITSDARLFGTHDGNTNECYVDCYYPDGSHYIDSGAGVTIKAGTISDIRIIVKSGKTVNTLFYCMVTYDLAATSADWEPYVGGIPSPNPDYPQEIKSVVNPTIKLLGSNILKMTDSEYQEDGVTVTVSNGVVKLKGTANTNLNYMLTENKIIYKEGTEIIFSPNKVKGIEEPSSSYLDLSNNSTIGFSIVNENINTPYTIKKEDAEFPFILWIRIQAGINYDETWKPQVLIGKTITAFKPYTEQTVTLPYTLNAIPVESGGNVTINGQQYIADYADVERGKLVKMVDSSKLDNAQSIVNKTEWLLAEPQEIDLTQEEMQTLKTLATYYPTTNIFINSEQLDGYTVFNYPISMKNGWDYVKKQLNDNRDYIYDMDTQSAEAYVNSEYAVALTELEV